MATIKDVAKLAGVSVATVSRAINYPDSVSDNNKTLVENAIKELNYTPNLLGRNLRTQQTKRIIVVLNSISNQFYSRVLKGIEDKAKEDGYTTLICTTRDNKQTILSHLQILSTREADGAIFMSPELANQEILKYSKHYPIVCASEPVRNKKITSVTIDDVKASCDAVNFLISQGKKRIALISAGSFSYSSDLREKGYKKALKQNNIELDESLIIREGYTYNAGVRAIDKILKLEALPDAIFALSDTTAIGAINQLHKNKINVPEDISVMGFDNTAMSEVYIPTITTVAQPQHDLGYKAMELLINKINGKTQVDSIVLPHRIIHRESVKK